MNTKLLLAVTIVLLGLQSSVVGQKSKKIYIRVVDEKGEPVQGAEVDAMYLQIIKQDGKEYRLPQVLAKAETNHVGRVDLVLPSMEWKFAGLHARIREMTTDEMIDSTMMLQRTKRSLRPLSVILKIAQRDTVQHLCRLSLTPNTER